MLKGRGKYERQRCERQKKRGETEREKRGSRLSLILFSKKNLAVSESVSSNCGSVKFAAQLRPDFQFFV